MAILHIIMCCGFNLNPRFGARLSPLSQAQNDENATLSTILDSQIDMSEIPLLSHAFWQQAIRNPFFKQIKQSTTVRVDSDLLMWLILKARAVKPA